MRICPEHWAQVRAAVAERGLEHLGAKTGEEACANAVEELNTGEAPWDPLMAMNWNFVSRALSCGGLAMFNLNEDGSEKCPLCEAKKGGEASGHSDLDQDWIKGCADAMLEHARELGLVPEVQ